MDSVYPGRWWHTLEDGRIQCDLCPRDCRLREEQRGHCFVRQRLGDRMVLTTYGRSSGFCVDPIEKKPLNHFFPGSAVLSFGTAGCNLACRFCQNWDISKSRDQDRLADQAGPKDIVRAALRLQAKSVAFTYNDPIIFAEYAMDVADACHEEGIRTVAVTAGYVHAQPREEFFGKMDAANVDLKAFTEKFYWELTGGHLEPILDTLRYLAQETSVWLEITTLLIPDHNDSVSEVGRLSEWVLENLGPEIPIHFSAFHPDFKMLNLPRTPPATLVRARKTALEAGLRHVYTGNVHDLEGDTTFCPQCKKPVIQRDWYEIGAYQLTAEGNCEHCGRKMAGCFEAFSGAFGRNRMAVSLGEGGL